MKRFIMLPVLLVAALALAATGLADPGDKGKGKNGKAKAKFTFTFTNTDNGSCGGQPWATLLETRKFTVKDNHDGTFTLTRRDKGTFSTIGGPSPGACETGSKHGKTVRTGVKGTFQGYLVGTVTAKSFNPKAACPDVSVCETREGFLNTYFSPDRVYSCDANSADCKFNYNYTAPNKGTNKTPKLLYRHWQDKGKGAGTMLNEVFKGDIANT